MRKLMTDVFQAALILCLILSLVVAGDMQTAKAENNQSLEGEWITQSSWDSVQIGQRTTIIRKGDEYKVRTDGPSESKTKNMSPYYGTPTQIMATHTPSYDDLLYMYSKAASSDLWRSVFGRVAGKFIERHRITLSSDGQSAEYAVDGTTLSSDGSYKTTPFKNKTTMVRVASKAPAQTTLSSAVAQVESRGEFYVLTRDGRKLTGEDANQIPLEEGTKVITGSSGHVQMKLPDDTTFTIGPNSDIVIDSFVYDPDNTPKKVIANVSKGVFRWVTGKVKPLQEPAEMKVKLPGLYAGIRGTDFEATVNPDGSGSVILHFGQLEIMEKKTGFTFMMDAGYKVTFNTDGSTTRPKKLD